MAERDYQRPTDDPGGTDAVADGEPTPGRPRAWTDEPPGSGDWKDADNDDARGGDRDRELAATDGGQHGTSPREFTGHDRPGAEEQPAP